MVKVRKVLLFGLAKLLLNWLRSDRLPRALAYPVIGAVIWLMGAVEKTWEYSPEYPVYCRALILNRGPGVKNLRAVPSPAVGTKTIRVWGTLVDTVGGMFDPQSKKIGVSGAVAWVDSIPEGYKGGEKMKATDGAFDSDSEDVFLDMDITGLVAGRHRVFVSGWDMEGMLGSPDSIDIEITE